MTGGITLGRAVETDEEVVLSPDARRLSTYIIGKIGAGKSTLLENIAVQDMELVEGLCFLDPHEDSAEALLTRVPEDCQRDVIFWDPTDRKHPFGINPFYCPDPEQIDSRADNFIAAVGSLAEFSEIFKIAPRMKDVLQHLAIAFIVNQGYTLAETPEFLTNETFRRQFYPALSAEYPQVRRFWQEFDDKSPRRQREQIESSLNKLRRFQVNRTMRGIFGQPENSIDFRRAMDWDKVIIVKLSSQKLGPDNAAFIGAFIVWEILQAALSRSDLPEEERRPFHLIADEFQTFMTTAFPRLQAEARKFGVDTTVAHQTRGQLGEQSKDTTRVLGNTVVFQVSGRDARELAQEFEIQPPEPEVTGERRKYVLATNPLDHIAKHGHEDPQVVDAYRMIDMKINHYFDRVSDFLEQATRETRRSGRGVGVNPTLYVDQRREEFIHRLNKILYEMMRNKELAWIKARVKFSARWEDMEDNKITKYVDDLGEHWHISGEDWTEFAYEVNTSNYDQPMPLHITYEAAKELGSLLQDNPCLVASGQLEPIKDRPRPYSDVEAEVANELATLPRYTARCRLLKDGQPTEYTIRTIAPPEATTDGERRAQAIKDRSRRDFGTDREVVEKGIEDRLQFASQVSDVEEKQEVPDYDRQEPVFWDEA